MANWNIDAPSTEYYDHQTPGLESVIREVMASPEVAIDSETTGLVLWKDVPLYWSLAFGSRRMTLNVSALHKFKEAFADPTKHWIFANAKFDAHMFANVGVHIAGKLVDTCVMHALLYEEKPHGLKDMNLHLFNWQWQDFQDTFGKISKDNSPLTIIQKAEAQNFPLLCEYAANDSWGTLQVYNELKRQLQHAPTYSLFRGHPLYIETLWDLFYKVEVPYTKVLFNVERNGVLVNQQYLHDIAPTAVAEIEDIERSISKEAGRVLNPGSTQQLAAYFFDQMQVKPLKMTKGGKTGVKKPSVDEGFLSHYKDQIPMAKLVLRHRELKKLHGTYIVGLQEHMDPHGRIHTRFNQDTVRTGRLSSSSPNCFHPETQVLTRAGWVALKDLQQGEQVAQWDAGVVSFVEPTGYVQQPATELVHLNNEHTRLAITKDHRCLLRHRKTGEFRVFTAEQYPEDWQQIHAGQYEGGQLRMPRSVLRLLVATQADGHINGKGIDFGFKKQRKVDRLLELVKEAGFVYSYSVDQRGRHRIRIGAESASQLISVLGPEKRFGPWLLNLAEELIDVFNDETMFWDGSWTRKNNYSSDDKANTTWVQTMYALRGVRGHMRSYEKQSGGLNWQVDLVKRDYSHTTNITKTIEPYTGDVYCVSVPSSYLLVRYQDQICVTGNCQNIPKPENDKWKLRGAFIAAPYYELIVADYEQLEMRLLACASLEQGMIDVINKGWDIHMGNASMIFGIPYDEIKQAKGIEKKVGAGELPSSALTQRVTECLSARSAAKNIGFGLIYGMGPDKLANSLNVTRAEAETKISQFKRAYPAVDAFTREAVAETERTGYAFTILGRRRNVTEIASYRRDERSRGERLAVNTQIQGSAADVVKLAQILLFKSGIEQRFGAKQNLQVHDEVMHECPKETAAEAEKEIQEWMEHPFPWDLAVPLSTSINRGDSWLSAK